MAVSTFSHSGLDSFRTCPRRYKFEVIDRVDVPTVSAAKQLGTAVHKQLQVLYQRKSDGKEYPLDEMLAAYDKDWSTSNPEDLVVVVEHMTIDDYIERGRKMLTDYYEANHPFEHGRILGVERHLNFALPGTNFNFRGVVDRLVRKPDGAVEICDYKTSRNLPNGVKDPSFGRQMALYHIGLQQLFPDFDQIEVCQYFLKFGEAIRYRFSQEELDIYAEEFRVAALDIIHAQRLDHFETHESALCEYCDFYRLCPAKRHRLMLEDEEDEKTDAVMASELASKYARLDLEGRKISAELEALREQLIKAAQELALDKFVSDEGEVTVKLKTEEKFPTKSRDPKGFSDLLFQVKQWGLEECLTLDANTLLKEFYLKNKLDRDQMLTLKELLVTRLSARLSVKRRKNIGDDNDDNDE